MKHTKMIHRLLATSLTLLLLLGTIGGYAFGASEPAGAPAESVLIAQSVGEGYEGDDIWDDEGFDDDDFWDDEDFDDDDFWGDEGFDNDEFLGDESLDGYEGDDEGYSSGYLHNLALFDGEKPPLFLDLEGLVDYEEADEILARLQEVSDKHDFDVAIAVMPWLDERDAVYYAADFYEDNAYGRGVNSDGCLLLLAMEERDFAFVSFGRGESVFTPSGQAYLDSFFLPQLSAGQYAEAFMGFADGADEFLTAEAEGRPYDAGTIPGEPEATSKKRGILSIGSIIVSFLTSLFVTGGYKSQLKSVRGEAGAAQYIRPGSLNVTGKKDVFLYTKRAKTPRVKSSSGESNAGTISTSSGKKGTGHSGKF
ncbi:MAG TPA: TPM domain-containing protein [Clostridiales bacterium]|nr:TPM domain-containing protein [Clostridiales bacterium]